MAAGSTSASPVARLGALHQELEACTRCPEMIGPVVHGPPVKSPLFLIGQAPGATVMTPDAPASNTRVMAA